MKETTYDVDFVIDKPHKPYFEIEIIVHTDKTKIIDILTKRFRNNKVILSKFILQEEILLDNKCYNYLFIAFGKIIKEQIDEAKKLGVYCKNTMLTFCSIRKKEKGYDILIKVDGEYHG